MKAIVCTYDPTDKDTNHLRGFKSVDPKDMN